MTKKLIGVLLIVLIVSGGITIYYLTGKKPVVTEQNNPATETAQSVTVLAAGDIASCQNENDTATAAILAKYPDASILTLGDNAYESGKLSEFLNCFEPTWGQYKDRMFPSIGNHDYGVPGAADYFTYFNKEKPGYYSFDLGDWQLIALDSNCSVVGCDTGSEQQQWLTNTLSQSTARCTIAYMHHPRFSSGKHGDNKDVDPLWKTLWSNGVDIVLAGHDHIYERFQPLAIDGSADPETGMRSFVVGTGGREFYQFKDIHPTSATRNNTEYGVLKLDLGQDTYSWEFLPTTGGTFSDTGSGTCR